LERNGGRRRKHTYEQATEQVAAPESTADIRRMLAEVMPDICAGKMDPKLGNHARQCRNGPTASFEIADFEKRLERLEQANVNESTPQEAGAAKE
jgi:hypothetical protein